jgi:exopolysaccharide production protein ExoZ
MNTRFVSVQYLRAIAALAIVVLHWANAPKHTPLHGGVDLFFVISGFVMVTSTYGRAMSFKDFMVARIQRIVPLYWIGTFAAGALLIADGVSPTLRDWTLSLLFIPHASPLYPTNLRAPILVPGWTLCHEMFFYVLFGATLFLKPRRQVLALSAIFLGLLALRPWLGSDTALGFRFTSPLQLEFLAGCLIGLWTARSKTPVLSLPWAGVLLVMGLLIGAVIHRIDPATERAVAFGIPSVLILIAAVAAERHIAAWEVKPLSFLGDASYSIYLFHIPIFALMPLLVGTHAVVSLVLTLATACLIHIWIEKPATKLVKGRYRIPHTAPAVSLVPLNYVPVVDGEAGINPRSELPR